MTLFSHPVGSPLEAKTPTVMNKKVNQANGYVTRPSVAVMYVEFEYIQKQDIFYKIS